MTRRRSLGSETEGEPRSPRSFASVLEQVAQLSRERSARADGEGSASVEGLHRALAQLELEPRLKLWVLMAAGKKGEDVAAVSAAMVASESESASSPMALAAYGSALAEHLQRGRTIAVATGLDLERPLASWSAGAAKSLDDRAWVSFARQLAMSQPGEWESFGVFSEQNPARLTTMYLRLTGKSWWSFRGVLDRPSSRTVERARKVQRARMLVGGEPLQRLVALSGAARGPALARAMRAIRARLGAELQVQAPSAVRHG